MDRSGEIVQIIDFASYLSFLLEPSNRETGSRILRLRVRSARVRASSSLPRNRFLFAQVSEHCFLFSRSFARSSTYVAAGYRTVRFRFIHRRSRLPAPI